MINNKSLSLLFSVLFSVSLFSSPDFPPFDRGPDLNVPMEKELLDIIQELPYLPGISTQLQVLTPTWKEGQKMRPDFGAMPVRGFLEKDSIKVLVIGQDGTHIAEGANRPGIAGFGGRVQDIMKHFGIYEGVLFTNLYVNTISGQYGSRNTPIFDSKNNRFINNNVIENRQWLLTHDGAYSEWRNRFISWVIRNNLNSLKMVVMLGQAGKDAGANFVTSIGGKIDTNDYYIDIDRFKTGDGSHFQVPQFEMVGAGGNNEWAVPLTKEGKDVAEELRKMPGAKQRVEEWLISEIERLEKKRAAIIDRDTSMAAKRFMTENINRMLENARLDFPKKLKAVEKELDYRNVISQSLALDLINSNPEEAKKFMVFSKGGPQKNGVLYPQQFGGWNIATMQVKDKYTQSIQGLRIPCFGSKIGKCARANSIAAPNVIFVGSPHPTYLSNKEREIRGSAAKIVEKDLIQVVEQEVEKGWVAPTPEPGQTSNFIARIKCKAEATGSFEEVEEKCKKFNYRYGRGIIPPSHGDPGITDLRLLPVSTAQRLSFNTQGEYERMIDGKKVKDREPRGIVINTRGFVQFDKKKIAKMIKDKPATKSLTKSNTVLTGRPQIDTMVYKYDRGPSDSYAKILYSSLDIVQVAQVKDVNMIDTGDLDGDKDKNETHCCPV